MPVATQTVLFDIKDAKVAPVTADDPSTGPTFGALVDIPGISQLGIDPSIISAKLKGDSRVVAVRSRIESFTASITNAKLDLDFWATVLTSNSVTVVNTDDQELGFGSGELPAFKFVGQIVDVDTGVGDVHVELFICRATGGSMFGQSADNFGEPTLTFECVEPQDGTDALLVTIHNAETAIA